MGWIKTGTVTVANGSATVTGSGTTWVDVGTVNSGDIMTLPDGKMYEILTVNSNTGITLASVYLGTSLGGQTYYIWPIGLLPSTLAQQVKATLTTANNALASTVRYDINSMGLSLTQQQNARTNIAALSALDVGAGRLSKSVAGGVDVTLSASEASAQFIELTGTITANINVIVPAAARQFFVYNGTTGAFNVTVKTAAGTGVIVPNAARVMLECDATNVVNPLNVTADYFTAKGLRLGADGTNDIYLSASAHLHYSTNGSAYSHIFGNSSGGVYATIASTGITVAGSMSSSGSINNNGTVTSSLAEGVLTLGVNQGGGTMIEYHSSGNLIVTPRSGYDVNIAAGNLTPGTNGAQAFGSTSLRWSQVWCTAGAFNTSDARLKTPVTLLNETEKQAAAQFSREIGTFQWLDSIKEKGAENARHHVGITVQRAQEILESFGLNPWRYGFMSYDKWDDEFVDHPAIESVAAVAALLDEEGKVITPAVEAIEAKAAWTEQTKKAGDAYAFRYDQLNMFIAAGIESRIAAIESITH